MANQNVGRDELAALLGASHASDMVTAAGTSSSDINKKSSTSVGASTTTKHYTKGGEDNIDISKMDRAQAAALVARKFAAGGQSSEAGSSTVRHRASGKRKRMLQHHLLASDLLEQQQLQQQQQDLVQDEEDLKLYEKGAEEDNDEEEGDAFSRVDIRKKNEAKVLAKKSSDSSRRRGRRGSSSSSSSSDSESSNSSSDDNSTSKRRRNRRRNRRSRSNSSSSSSEDEADIRRRRAIERKALQDKQNDNKTKVVVSSSSINHDANGIIALKKDEEEIVMKDVKMQHSDDMSVDNDESPVKEEEIKVTKPQKETKRGRSRANSSSSSSSGDSSSSSSSDSSSSSSSSDDSDDHKSTLPTTISKPLFVPKSKRGTVAEIELQQQKHDNAEKLRAQQAEKRAIQSRALVAEAVSASGKNGGTTNEGIGGEDEFDTGETGGEFIVVPDDTDPTEEDSPELVMAERDAWEVRELVRILRDVDEALAREKEKKELERRRGLSDNERLMEDKRSGRYRAPGESRRQQRADGDKNKSYLQKFHHRGAFYMDEDTLDQAGADDIRHKAAEYSKAATGSDKIDKSALPEVMQVKNFGLAGYSTKYKGLAKEDTTDKKLDFLPIRGHKKKGGRNGGAERTERRERY